MENKDKIVYVNDKHDIMAIVSYPISSYKDYVQYSVPYEDVKGILEERKGMIHYTVAPDKDNPLKMRVVKKNYEIDNIRKLDNFLTEVRTNLKIKPQIIIENYLNDKQILVKINEKTRKALLKDQPSGTSISVMGITTIDLHFTTKNDPCILFQTVKVSIGELLTNGVIAIKYDMDLSNASVFTKKIFPNYIYEVKDELC